MKVTGEQIVIYSDSIEEAERWIQENDPSYFNDYKGDCYLIIPEMSTMAWMNTFANPRPVLSVLNYHEILAFHVLAEIEGKEISSNAELMRWYKRSLAYLQGVTPFSEADGEGLMGDLQKMEMIGYSGIKPFVTGLGKVSAWLYYSPYDVSAWYKNFSNIFNVKDPDDLCFAWALGNIPSNDLGYVPKELQSEAGEIGWLIRNRIPGAQVSGAVGTVIAIHEALKGTDTTDLKAVIKAMRRSVIFDIDRITQALSLADGMYAKWGKESLWASLSVRIKYGIGEELLDLVKIPGIGGKRAKKLYEAGFKTPQSVLNASKKELGKVFPVNFASKIQQTIKEMFVQ